MKRFRIYLSNKFLIIIVFTFIFIMMNVEPPCLLNQRRLQLHQNKNSQRVKNLHGSNELAHLAILTEQMLAENLKLDKYTGCAGHRPILKAPPAVVPIPCPGINWIKCFLSMCTVNPEIWQTLKHIKCTYLPIVFINDTNHNVNPNNEYVRYGNHTYRLKESDHVKVICSAKSVHTSQRVTWMGFGVGFRKVTPLPPPPGREKTYNILIVCFDSASHQGFSTYMPKTYKFLKEDFNAVILNRYNILGDGTPATLLPLLTGRTELELPDCRRDNMDSDTHVDSWPLLFYKLKEDGYRTAYFEDMPSIGSFTYRYKGFQRQPTDHYLRPLLMEAHNQTLWDNNSTLRFCMGDAPLFQTMLNLTDQFFYLDGKKFSVTFVSDITHEEFSLISNADQPMVKFLRKLKQRNVHDTTLIIVMGDHGIRYFGGGHVDDRFMERSPMMAIRLPEDMIKRRPMARWYLEKNANVLTTPHDIHATLLDVLDMRQHWNSYKVKGAELLRGLTLLREIPAWRSCSEAGIEPHWCACAEWQPLDSTDPMYLRTADALINAINDMTSKVRSKCVLRVITHIFWVKQLVPNKKVLQYRSTDLDGFNAIFSNENQKLYYYMHYMVKISVSPEIGIFEATMTHHAAKDTILIHPKQISRTNAYAMEPECISEFYPNLNPYCYCYRNRTS